MARSWLLFRRGGCIWAAPREQVSCVSRSTPATHVWVGAHLLVVDEVMQFADLPRIYRLGPVLRSVVPTGCSGIAASELGPLLVIDADSPPAVLCSPDQQQDQQEEVNDVT
jgi:hypothetical protein